MKKLYKQLIIDISGLVLLMAPNLSLVHVSALERGTPVNNTQAAPTESSTSSSPPATDGSIPNSTAGHLTNIQNKGNEEISRRIATLNKLTARISGASKLTASDKTSLTNEVQAEINGLTTLKATLDGETTIAAAAQDVASMVTEYRVYALIVPKIQIIRAADDQQVLEGKLTTLASKLSARLTQAQSKGENVTALLSQIADMTNSTAAAQKLSSSVEASVIALQPADYDADHALLSQYRTQLATAHTDCQAAYNDAKSIISGIKDF